MSGNLPFNKYEHQRVALMVRIGQHFTSRAGRRSIKTLWFWMPVNDQYFHKSNLWSQTPKLSNASAVATKRRQKRRLEGTVEYVSKKSTS
jgi:hypothetical protein